MKKLPNIIYISHGGGPLPLLGSKDHDEMIETLKTMSAELPKPSAILLISAHWENTIPTVTSVASPELIYDYGGFPQSAYEIEYPASGQPELATSVIEALSQNGIEAKQDQQRGFDHGMFVPMKLMYPDADIPCVQLSLVNDLNPSKHIKIGKALRSLNWDNLLVIGSGSSFHNMQAFFSPESELSRNSNLSFDDWLSNLVSDQSITEDEREHKLINWLEAPGAKYCHPREEHLMPLHICYGMASKPSSKSFSVEIMKKQSSMFCWFA